MIDSYLMTLPESESAECQILYNYKIYIYSNESLIIVSHVRMYSGEGGGYSGLVVVTPPRPQTFIFERHCLMNPERIASMYM